MARVLLVDPDANRRAEIEAALSDAGHDVAVAPSGSFALTMLEWDRQDLILSQARVHDMGGEELLSIVRSDPATREIRFLLVGASGGDASTVGDARVERVEGVVLDITAIVARVARLLDAHAPSVAPPAPLDAPREEPSPAHAEPASPVGPVGAGLAEITNGIAARRETGHLAIALASGDGIIGFEGGRIVHAQFRGLTGRKAFAALVWASEWERSRTFAFNPATSGDATSRPQTIQGSVDSLLVSITAKIDAYQGDVERPTAGIATSEEGG